MNELFREIGIIVIIATACAMLARIVKQPPLFGYIVAGIILGPLGAHTIHNQELLDAMKQMGIALLLFLVGIELDWNKAKHQFKSAWAIGGIQVVASFATGLLLAYVGRLGIIGGIYIGLALAFSSTVIVVKLLSEMRDLNSLHGRIAIGVLLIQDAMAILALIIASGLNSGSSLPVPQQLLFLLLKTAALLTIVWGVSTYVLPPLFIKIAKSAELLFLASISWCFIFTMLMYKFDIPMEIGAFLAGISLAALPYGLDIVSRLRSLRDFFVILLFVSLGSSLVLPSLPYILLTAGFLLLTIIGKPLITFTTLTGRGFKSRTAFMTALTQTQLSEFSLIIVGIGLKSGHIPAELASSISFTAVISLLLSTLILNYRNALYRPLRKVLRVAERGRHSHELLTEEMSDRLQDHVIIFGYHRMGYHILKKLRQTHQHALIVDFNPDIISALRAQDVDCVYGDVEDEEIFEHIQVEKAKLVVSTIPHKDENSFLIERVKKMNRKTQVIVTAHSVDDALHYYHLGADYVIMPHLLGGEHVADLIINHEDQSLATLMRHRQEELKLLRDKKHALYYD